jgi:hypothetical protein
MNRTLISLLAGLVGVTALAENASAGTPHKAQGLVVFQQDGDNVKKVFDDGNLDGRGCIIGKEAVFDPTTGGLKVVPKVKCNFPN